MEYVCYGDKHGKASYSWTEGCINQGLPQGLCSSQTIKISPVNIPVLQHDVHGMLW